MGKEGLQVIVTAICGIIKRLQLIEAENRVLVGNVVRKDELKQFEEINNLLSGAEDELYEYIKLLMED